MESNQEASEQKQQGFGVKAACIVGAGVWWFLTSQPSSIAMLLATFFLLYLFLGFCVLAIMLPGPESETSKEAFVPLPQSEVNRPKALTF